MTAAPANRRLEEVLLNATAPPEQLLYDGWLLRLSREHIKRASSVNAPFPSALPLREKVEVCERTYRQRDLKPIFRITSLDEAGELDRELADRGYRVFEPSLVLTTASVAGPVSGLPLGMRFAPMAIEPWVEMVGHLRGWPRHDVEAHTRRLTASVLTSRCLSLMDGSEVASCGLVTIEGDYAGLFDIYTAPGHRDRGLATLLCARLIEVGSEHGASAAWLSVLADNAPALSVYGRLGFRTAYRYWYRVPADYPGAPPA